MISNIRVSWWRWTTANCKQRLCNNKHESAEIVGETRKMEVNDEVKLLTNEN